MEKRNCMKQALVELIRLNENRKSICEELGMLFPETRSTEFRLLSNALQSSLTCMESNFNVEVEKHEKDLEGIELFFKTAFWKARRAQMKLMQNEHDKELEEKKLEFKCQLDEGILFICVPCWFILIFSLLSIALNKQQNLKEHIVECERLLNEIKRQIAIFKIDETSQDDNREPYSKVLRIKNEAFFSEKDLRHLFQNYGIIEKIKINSWTTFICFDNKENAEKARKNLNGYVLKGKELNVVSHGEHDLDSTGTDEWVREGIGNVEN